MAAVMPSCSTSKTNQSNAQETLSPLRDSLQSIADSAAGEVGIALLTDRGDTLLVNNEDKYPLMSVFKLHQAIALSRLFVERGCSLDSVVRLERASLNPETWSPMLKDYPEGDIRVPVRKLMEYTLTQSDNNASNYMFRTLQGVVAADSCVAGLIPRESFRLAVTEEDIWSDHSLAYRNHSSPLGAALLIDRLFTDSIVPGPERDFICRKLAECKTGTDRIVAPLADKKGVVVAHKTGSGFRDADGVLSAHNDVAFVTLPTDRYYTLAVLVKDYHGSEAEAARVISRVSAAVWSALAGE